MIATNYCKTSFGLKLFFIFLFSSGIRVTLWYLTGQLGIGCPRHNALSECPNVDVVYQCTNMRDTSTLLRSITLASANSENDFEHTLKPVSWQSTEFNDDATGEKGSSHYCRVKFLWNAVKKEEKRWRGKISTFLKFHRSAQYVIPITLNSVSTTEHNALLQACCPNSHRVHNNNRGGNACKTAKN